MEKKNLKNEITSFSNDMRSNILEMSLSAGSSSSHFGGALSIVEILSTLYVSQLKYDPKNPLWEGRDRFILSKGHACLAYYSALCQIGYVKFNDLLTFEKDDSDFLGHPVKNEKLGIEFSNGSLGMGLSLGIGVAYALKKKQLDNFVYVVIGDGECNEGSVWEAAMSAPNLKLDNLYAIIDRNNFQQTGSNSEIMNLDDLKLKWSSFGWHTDEIDGHDVDSLLNYFDKSKNIKKPKALIANTIKGKGFSFSENNNEWHHKILTKSTYENALKEIKKIK
tara:strand:+ start:2183 stop:3016 length:834 start_codon:yes stop_codon:yes gene_type:complete